MIFIESALKGAFLIEPELIADKRGFFARCFCKREFAERGIDFSCAQCNLSYNEKAGTLRGMHFQKEPYSEAKIVSCISGSVNDVIADMREGSPTRYRWQRFFLSVDNRRLLYIPKGFAHGFVTLEDKTCLYYHMSEFYRKGCEGGLRYDDPTLAIDWGYDGKLIISDRDLRLETMGGVDV